MDWTQVLLAFIALVGTGATAIFGVFRWLLGIIQEKDRESHALLQDQANYFKQQMELAYKTQEALFDTVRADRQEARAVIVQVTDGYKEHTIISKGIAQNLMEHTKAITDLTQQVSRVVERIDRMESRL